jgi:hypothetical protein
LTVPYPAELPDQMQKSRWPMPTSGLPFKADIRRSRRFVR